MCIITLLKHSSGISPGIEVMTDCIVGTSLQKIRKVCFGICHMAFGKDVVQMLMVKQLRISTFAQFFGCFFHRRNADFFGVDVRAHHSRACWQIAVESGGRAIDLDILEWGFVVPFKTTRTGFYLYHLSLSFSFVLFCSWVSC